MTDRPQCYAKASSMTAERLRSLLSYGEKTGVFSRIADTPKNGKKAGSITPAGYITIVVGGEKHLAHRLAWLHYYGEWPKLHIDHINNDRKDNAILNLRLATPLQNVANKRINKNNSCGFKGVVFHAQSGKWRARIGVDRKAKSLGLFSTKEDAAAAYAKAAMEVYGAFARSG